MRVALEHFLEADKGNWVEDAVRTLASPEGSRRGRQETSAFSPCLNWVGTCITLPPGF